MVSSDYQKHFKANFFLAYPVVLSQLGHILVSVADSIMVGRLGTIPLAAASLGNSIFTIVLVFGLGLSYSITPLVASARGRNNPKRISLLLINGLIVSISTGLLLFIASYLLSPLLYYLNQPEEVVALTIPYLQILFFSMIPLMIFQGYKQFSEGLSITRQSMYVSVFANLLNVAANYVLIYGKLGFPAFGMNGAAIATLASRILMAFIMAWFIHTTNLVKPFRLRWKKKYVSFRHMKRIIRLGFPISMQMIFEMGAFSFSAIMIGWLGARQLAAHQIAINVAALTYMMASGIGAAATIRVGTLFGEGKLKEMRTAGLASLIMAIIFMSTTGLILVLANELIPQFYIQDPQVIEIAAGLLVIAAIFQISDGVQVVGLGCLRGLEDVKIPSMLSLLAYWVAGLPIGYLLCFKFKLGVNGIWIGLLIGLSVAALLLYLRFQKLSKEK